MHALCGYIDRDVCATHGSEPPPPPSPLHHTPHTRLSLHPLAPSLLPPPTFACVHVGAPVVSCAKLYKKNYARSAVSCTLKEHHFRKSTCCHLRCSYRRLPPKGCFSFLTSSSLAGTIVACSKRLLGSTLPRTPAMFMDDTE